MECKVTGDNILIHETVFEGSAEQPVDVEFTLPDYCPDIGRLLKCRAAPIIQTREVGSDGITVGGTLRLEVLYTDGRGGGVRCCTHDMPFRTPIAAAGLPEGTKVSACARVEYINCRAASQRRLDIHGAFTVQAAAACQRQCGYTDAAEGAGVLVRRSECTVSSAAGRSQSAFTISEAFDLPDSKPPIAAIVRSSAALAVGECKPIANKLMIKGTAGLTVVYCTDDGALESMEYSVPFSQFLDLNGADDECACDAAVSAESVELSLRTDSAGEYRRFSADIKCFADARAYRDREITVVSDAYSTRFGLKLEKRMLPLCRYTGEQTDRARVQGRLEFSGGIAEVLDAWCESASPAAFDGSSVSGGAVLCAIVRMEEGGCEYGETTCRYECAPAESGEDMLFEAAAVPSGCEYSLSGQNGIEVRGELRVRTAAYRRLRVPCVAAIEPDEDSPRPNADAPAVTMYFASAGEELWDIAREHNASVEDIMSDNELTEDRLTGDKLLLISAG